MKPYALTVALSAILHLTFAAAGVAICVFVTHEPITGPLALAAGSFVVPTPGVLAVCAVLNWADRR